MTEEQPNVNENPGDIKKTISIAILLCGNPSESTVSKFGSYDNMFRNVFTEALATIPRYEWHPKISLYLRSFNVVLGEFPEVSELDDGVWDAVLVTGTPESCTQENVLWMDVLRKYLVHVTTVHPLVRVIGICFGHQLIAQAFGAQVVQDKAKAERLEQLHEDAVMDMPQPVDGDAWELVGSSEKAKIQGLALRYPTEAPPLPSSVKTSSYIAFDVDDSTTSASGPLPIRNLHVFTLQGHPEFNTAVTENELTALHNGQVLDEATYAAAFGRASEEQDGLETARMLLAMLGVEPALAQEEIVL
ncbi:GMP synthase (glutamine-hydrolyzing) [Malassezia brasiliensis]|uniref:GMP synthase (Glutamine-hydrolyzing) n=1 Tax=Malassezia brasiliensis TaxID=1821822 RepID=A0AAF0DV10_9BASI|nr:GMP synthase (glutamine-hydrolyzing) [Malassezia brasiliensis]